MRVRRLLTQLVVVSFVITLVPEAGLAHDLPSQVSIGQDQPPGALDPAHSVIARRAHQVFEFRDGQVDVVNTGLDEGERAFALELRDSLNTGVERGWLDIREGSDEVTFTDSGKAEVEAIIREAANPCVEISNLTVSWRGYAYDMETICTDEEIEAMIASASSEGEASRMVQHHANPVQTIFGTHFWCWVSVAGLVFGAVGAVFLIAFPPTAGIGLAWVAVIVTLGSSYIGTVMNCTGIRAVRVDAANVNSVFASVEMRTPQSRVNCRYSSMSSYRYDSIARTNVPTRIRWNC